MFVHRNLPVITADVQDFINPECANQTHANAFIYAIDSILKLQK